MIEEDTPRGLDGWLALLCISLIVTPIWILVESRDTPSIFTDGSWAALTTPGAEAYIPHYKSLMIAEVGFQLARLLFSVILLILFSREHYLFPGAYIAFRVFDLSFHLLNSWLAVLVFDGHADVSMFDTHTVQQLLLTGIPSAVWIPYILKSRRVKVTFVRGKAGSE